MSDTDEKGSDIEEGNEDLEEAVDEKIYMAPRIIGNDPLMSDKIHWGASSSIFKNSDLRTYIEGNDRLSKINEEIQKRSLDYNEIFEILLNIAASHMKIKGDTLDDVIGIIPKLPGVGYINAKATILGYMTLDKVPLKKGEEHINLYSISKKKVNKISNDYSETYKVSKATILRYAQMIVTNTSKNNFLEKYL